MSGSSILIIPVPGGSNAPSVTGIVPSIGVLSGGTSVVITGTRLTGATSVHFGTVAATSFVVNSSTQITAVSPPGSAGTVDVTVTTPFGSSPALANDQFSYVVFVPTIFTPSSPLNTENSNAAHGIRAVCTLSAASQGMIRVQFEPNQVATDKATGFTHMGIGKWAGTATNTTATPIEVTFNGGVSGLVLSAGSAPIFSDWVDVSSLTLNSGDRVVVTYDTDANGGFLSSSSNGNCTVGVGPTGQWNVASDGGLFTQAGSGAFDFGIESLQTQPLSALGVPTVTAVTPTTAPSVGGTTITVQGTNLAHASAVQFTGTKNGIQNAASFTPRSIYSLTAVTPPGSGPTNVIVTTQAGTSAVSPANAFTFLVPQIAGVSPNSGPTTGGTTVVITGSVFTGATSVTFGGNAATSFTVNSDTQITAVSPAGIAGTVDIVVTSPNGTSGTLSADHFTYAASGQTTIFTPSLALATTNNDGMLGNRHVCTLSGASQGLVAVQFTGNPTGGPNTGFTHMGIGKWNGTTSDTTATPIEVTFNGGQSGLSLAAGSPPTWSDWVDVSALSLAINDSVVITFDTDANGGYLSSNGETNCNLYTGAVGSWNNASDGGTFTLLTGHDHGISGVRTESTALLSTPTITSVTPNSGSTAGGTSVSIFGTGFRSVSSVKFGATNAASFVVNSLYKITAVTPAESAATVDITVTTPLGTSSVGAADKFTFSVTGPAAPVITSISPTGGATTGGNQVIINGTGFTAASAVKFGVTNASAYTVNSDTQITSTAPAESAGTVDISVTTSNGTSSPVAADQYTFSGTVNYDVTVDCTWCSWNYTAVNKANNFWWVYDSAWFVATSTNMIRYQDWDDLFQIDSATFPNNTKISWYDNAPALTPYPQVLGYPFLSFGYYAGSAAPVQAPPVTQLKNLTACIITYNVQIGGTSGGVSSTESFDGIFDVGIMPTASPPGTQSQEVEFAFHQPSWYRDNWLNTGSASNVVGNVTDQFGVNWTLWAWPGQVAPYAVWAPTTIRDHLVGSVDMLFLLNYMISKGLFTGNEYFVGVPIGCENTGGWTTSQTGFLIINSISLNYNGVIY